MTAADRNRIIALMVAPPLLLATLAITGLYLTPGMPARVAAHWGADGRVDRIDGVDSFAVLIGIMVTAITVLIVAFAIAPVSKGTSRYFIKTWVGLGVGVSSVISIGMYLSVLAQRGVTDPESVPLSAALVPMLVGAVVGVGLAILVARLVPRFPDPKGLSGEVVALDIADGEKVFWTQQARTPRLLAAVPIVILLAVAVLVAVVGLPIWTPLIIAAIIIPLMTTLSWRVVIDQRGITTTGLFGFPTLHTPLEQVAGAAAITVNAMSEYGGWGIRAGRSGSLGVITRNGEAIEVQRRSGANFVVTVDDAATGAGLLTALARR